MGNNDADRRECVSTYLDGLRKCLDALSLEQIVTFLKYLEQAYREDRQIFLIGNGGSAATASHMACDLGKNALPNQVENASHRIRAMALTDCTSWVTALANDIGYQHIFAEQLRNWLRPGDLVVAITGSGNSPNIVEAVRVAKAYGAQVVGILGFDGGQVRAMVDAYVLVPSANYGHVEDVHLVLDHLATFYFQSCVAAKAITD
jgi:D-sedoheptulose 7-phosphate isomerase